MLDGGSYDDTGEVGEIDVDPLTQRQLKKIRRILQRGVPTITFRVKRGESDPEEGGSLVRQPLGARNRAMIRTQVLPVVGEFGLSIASFGFKDEGVRNPLFSNRGEYSLFQVMLTDGAGRHLCARPPDQLN